MPAAPTRRSANPPWMQTITSRLTPAIKAIIALNVVAYFAFVLVPAVKEPVLLHLALGPSFRHEPWQVLTAMFVQMKGTSLFFDIIGLWFVGAFIERTQGTRRFLLLFLASGVVANLVTGLVGMVSATGIHAGPSTAILALFVAYARLYGPVPTQLLVGPSFKATHLAIVFIVLAVLGDLDQRDVAGIAGTLAGSLTGFLLGAPGGFKTIFGKLSKLGRSRPRYKVLDGGAAPPRRARKYWN